MRRVRLVEIWPRTISAAKRYYAIEVEKSWGMVWGGKVHGVYSYNLVCVCVRVCVCVCTIWRNWTKPVKSRKVQQGVGWRKVLLAPCFIHVICSSVWKLDACVAVGFPCDGGTLTPLSPVSWHAGSWSSCGRFVPFLSCTFSLSLSLSLSSLSLSLLSLSLSPPPFSLSPFLLPTTPFTLPLFPCSF